ncbi:MULTISPECIES: hypothetical protein [unclassified Novosphingobium]|uniref:hypothetical protein n=2 Tax=Novosphingobium TaxID=165696 RepID=UPI0025E85BEB|nr:MULTISPECIES: hypothetical protein [unclassified Novosphingobium]
MIVFLQEITMSLMPTSGEWRESSLCRTTDDWPFHWVAEITAIDPLTRSYTCIGTVSQAGNRRYDEALINLRLMTRAPAMLRLLQAVGQVLDMSDPDHDAFVDSAADCLDALLTQEEPLRALLAELAAQAAAPLIPAR